MPEEDRNLEPAKEAARIEAGVTEDERLAAEVRNSTPRPVEVDVPLDREELGFATRKSVLVEEAGSPEVFGGDLVVTDRRLVVHGPIRSLEIPLDDISEMAAVGAAVLQITLTVGRGVALQVDRPRMLRAQIQAVRRSGAVRQP